MTFTRKPGPETGLDRLVCTEFAQQRTEYFWQVILKNRAWFGSCSAKIKWELVLSFYVRHERIPARIPAVVLLADRFRAKREYLERFQRLLPESQGQNLALPVLHVPHSTLHARLFAGRMTSAAPGPLHLQGYLADTKTPPPAGSMTKARKRSRL